MTNQECSLIENQELIKSIKAQTKKELMNHFFKDIKEPVIISREQFNKLIDRECVENIIEDCVIIRMKDVPEYMAGIDLTWLDKEIAKIKINIDKRIKKLNEER